MTVARRFIAGVRDRMACVPEGRLNSERGVEIFSLNLSGTGRIRSNPDPTLSVPPGRRSLWMANPAINQRATIACPSGTKSKPASKCPNCRNRPPRVTRPED
jgi:hypothetical protein